MGTAILSVDLTIDGHETLSRALFGVAAAVWVGLAGLLAGRVLRDRPRVRHEATSPAALTGVAGTAVLGVRIGLLGWYGAAAALLAVALVLWLLLVPPVLRGWATPTVGVSFVLAVSTESLAVLAAVVAVGEDAAWLAAAALIPLALGLAAYLFVLARFDLRQLRTGRGDHWVAGGALAIAALACGRVAEGAQALAPLHGLADGLGTGSLVLWAAALAWLPILVAAELAEPRLGYDARRWSTVFPVGMYTACSFVVGKVEGAGGLVDFARVWIWVGLAVWALVAAGLVRRALAIWRAGDATRQRRAAPGA